MTIKKILKRIGCLLHDDRTVFHKDESIENWEEVQQERLQAECEKQKKEQEILATWFLQEEYINAGRFKRFILRLKFAFCDTRGKTSIPQIPKHIRVEIARCLLPDIIAYYESEQGQRKFAEWKTQREAEKKEKSEVARPRSETAST